MSVAGTVTPRDRAPLASSWDRRQTASSIGSSGSTSAKCRSTSRSRPPRAPFHSSSCTSGHQHASPEVNAASTRARTIGSPVGRSKWIQDEVSTRINGSFLATLRLEFLRRDQVGTGAGVLHQLGEALSTVEFGDHAHNRLALCPRTCEANDIRQFSVWNINGRLHASILTANRNMNNPEMRFRGWTGSSPGDHQGSPPLRSGGAPVLFRPRSPSGTRARVAGARGRGDRTLAGDRPLTPLSGRQVILGRMSPELIAIIAVGVAIAGLVLAGQRSLRQDIAGLRQDVVQLRERMAHLEGLLEGLREAIGARPAA